MASNANALDPNGLTAPAQAVAPVTASFAGYPPVAAGSLPSWLTDPAARGLGTDWVPTAPTAPDPIVLTPRDIPSEAPAPVAPIAAAPVADLSLMPGGGGEGNSDASGAGGSPGAENADAGADTGAEAGGTGADTGAEAGGTGAESGGGDSAEAGGSDAGGGTGAEAGGEGFFKGGIVTKNRLIGPNPRGPDDGFGPLNKGEGVLTAKAVKFYGRDIVSRLNNMLVPKEAMRETAGRDTD